MAIYILLLACVAVALSFLAKRFTRKRVPLPPGPPANPLVGHLQLIPPVGQDLFYYKMGQTYGDVIHFNVLGKSLIVMNSVRAIDLLDKRSNNYSDRPRLPIYELTGIGETLAFLTYGKEFRLQRKMFHQYFTKDKRKNHRPIQMREARSLARNLLSKPQDWVDCLLRFATAITIDIGYGHQVVANDDPYLKLAEDVCLAATECGPPGATAVDLFPFLRYFPSWFPGTYYASFARGHQRTFRKLWEYPFGLVTEQMAIGTAKTSFLASQLEALRDNAVANKAPIESIRGAIAILYIAGAETTSSTLLFFVLAMVLHLECQARAQEEIDAVIGCDRLPEFQDRECLPYLEYVLQETLRWNPVVPGGIPHKSLDDDVYNGMFIPKGSTIIANTRAMTLDENIYKNPFEFDPQRFVPPPKGRGEPFACGPFGFGRRVCPGRHLAEDSLWIAMATILSTLSITKAIDEDGQEIIPDSTPIAIGIQAARESFHVV